MSHGVLITRRQSIFIFFANPGRGGPQHPNQPAPASTDLLRPASAWICKKIKNALSPGYQDLMGHLILTTSPWSILTWITLVYMYIFCKPSIYFGCAHTCLSMVKYAILLIKFSLLTMNKIYGMCTKDIECFQNWLSVFKNVWMCSKYLNVFKKFEFAQKNLNVFKNIWLFSKILEFIQNELHVFYELCAETLAETIE